MCLDGLYFFYSRSTMGIPHHKSALYDALLTGLVILVQWICHRPVWTFILIFQRLSNKKWLLKWITVYEVSMVNTQLIMWLCIQYTPINLEVDAPEILINQQLRWVAPSPVKMTWLHSVMFHHPEFDQIWCGLDSCSMQTDRCDETNRLFWLFKHTSQFRYYSLF